MSLKRTMLHAGGDNDSFQLHTKFGCSGPSSNPSMQYIEKMGKFLQCTQETCHEWMPARSELMMTGTGEQRRWIYFSRQLTKTTMYIPPTAVCIHLPQHIFVDHLGQKGNSLSRKICRSISKRQCLQIKEFWELVMATDSLHLTFSCWYAVQWLST